MEYVKKQITVTPYVFEDTYEAIEAIQQNVLHGGDIRISYRVKDKPMLIMPSYLGRNELTAEVGNVVFVNEHGEVQVYNSMPAFLHEYEPVAR